MVAVQDGTPASGPPTRQSRFGNIVRRFLGGTDVHTRGVCAVSLNVQSDALA